MTCLLLTLAFGVKFPTNSCQLGVLKCNEITVLGVNLIVAKTLPPFHFESCPSMVLLSTRLKFGIRGLVKVIIQD